MWTIERNGARITGFFPDKESAEKALPRIGFQDAYVVVCEYLVRRNGYMFAYAHDIQGAMEIVHRAITDFVGESFWLGINASVAWSEDHRSVSISSDALCGPDVLDIVDNLQNAVIFMPCDFYADEDMTS